MEAARCKYVLMGDTDDSYDFTEAPNVPRSRKPQICEPAHRTDRQSSFD